MPPKKEEKRKPGAPVGNYKVGKLLKDILPPNSKAPRESVPTRLEGEHQPERIFEYEPLDLFPEWPGNDQANTHDYNQGCTKDENGEIQPFLDETKLYLPPSFKEFMKDQSYWLRPSDYIREVIAEAEQKALKSERKRLMQKKKNIRKQTMLSLGSQPPDDMTTEEIKLLEN